MNRKERKDMTKLLDKSELAIVAGSSCFVAGEANKGEVKFCINKEENYFSLPLLIVMIIEAYAKAMDKPSEEILGLLGELMNIGHSEINDKGVKNFTEGTREN